jgi:hypothetical protein
MAFGQRSKIVDIPNENMYGNGNGSPDDYKRDPEKLGQDRKMSRIAGPLPGLADSDSDSIGVDKQIELEAGNAIRYRTCGWKRVSRWSTFSLLNECSLLTWKRPQLFSFPSTYAWQSCHSRIRIRCFAGIEPHPTGYNTGVVSAGVTLSGNPTVLVIPAKGTKFVAGMNAFLNISYTFIGQITIPSFIAEMKEPKDFPKALWVVMICEIIVFGLVGSVVYVYTGTQYMTSPAFGSLGDVVYKKVAFSFMIPTLIFLGVLYASVSARFVFFRVFEGTRHKSSHTVVGWAAWGGILALTWIAAFIIAEVIPFFSDLLSLMSSLFDSFFDFIFWGMAYLRMRQADYGPGWWKRLSIRGYLTLALNLLIILIGIYFLGVGTYVSFNQLLDTLNFTDGVCRLRSTILSSVTRPVLSQGFSLVKVMLSEGSFAGDEDEDDHVTWGIKILRIVITWVISRETFLFHFQNFMLAEGNESSDTTGGQSLASNHSNFSLCIIITRASF